MQFNMPDLAIVFPGEIFLSGKRNSDGNLGGRDQRHAKTRSRPFPNPFRWNKLPMAIIIVVDNGEHEKMSKNGV